MRVALFLALLGFSLPAFAADQFDLICTAPQEKHPIRYRVDLAAGEWCWEACNGTSRLVSVTSTRITFTDIDTPSMKADAFVDRTTGEWFQSSQDRLGSFFNHGSCTPAPFSGFRTEERKF